MNTMFFAHQRIRKAMEEKKKAQTENAPDFEKMTVCELKDYAKSSGIIITGLSKKDDIKAKIIEALNDNNGKAAADEGGEPDTGEEADADDTNGRTT